MHEEAIYIVKFTREGDEFSTFVEADDAANAMFRTRYSIPERFKGSKGWAERVQPLP